MLRILELNEPAADILKVLHEHNVPIGMVDTVFDMVKEDIEASPVPYQSKETE